MKKVILYVASSIDGFIARHDGDISWLFSDQDYGYRSFLKTIDTVIMGRKTYEQVLNFGEYPYKSMRSYVVTGRDKLDGPDNKINLYNGSLPALVKKIRSENKKNIWLVGGGELAKGFINENIVDELILSIHPILLGRGIPLFKDIKSEKALQLIDCRKFSTGLMQAAYRFITVAPQAG